jgi:hypothetical protein
MRKLLLGVLVVSFCHISFAQSLVYAEKSLLGFSHDLYLYSKLSTDGPTIYLRNHNPVYLEETPGKKFVEIQMISGTFHGNSDREAVQSHLINNPGESLPVNIVSQTSDLVSEISSRSSFCAVASHHKDDALMREEITTHVYRNIHYVFSFLTTVGLTYVFTGDTKSLISTHIEISPCF